MFLAIRNGIVVERGRDEKPLLQLDETIYEIIEWNDPLPPCDIGEGEIQLDPRSKAQKAVDAKQRYRRRRLREYAILREQFDMIYWDAIDGTTTWVDEITRIKEKYPKSIE